LKSGGPKTIDGDWACIPSQGRGCGAPGIDGRHRSDCPAYTVSAVTAACLLVRKRVFEEVGGLDEKGLTVAFNDVDFCIKVRDAGYRNVLTRHAVLVHHESGWGDALKSDRYYSPHLTLEREDILVVRGVAGRRDGSKWRTIQALSGEATGRVRAFCLAHRRRAR
jgi:hypothetical protein